MCDGEVGRLALSLNKTRTGIAMFYQATTLRLHLQPCQSLKGTSARRGRPRGMPYA